MDVNDIKNNISDKIVNDIIEFCLLNEKDPLIFINSKLKDALTIAKYGDKPPMFVDKKNVVQKNTINDDENKDVVEKEVKLVDTPLEIPDNLPVFQEEEKPKRKKRQLNAK